MHSVDVQLMLWLLLRICLKTITLLSTFIFNVAHEYRMVVA